MFLIFESYPPILATVQAVLDVIKVVTCVAAAHTTSRPADNLHLNSISAWRYKRSRYWHARAGVTFRSDADDCGGWPPLPTPTPPRLISRLHTASMLLYLTCSVGTTHYNLGESDPPVWEMGLYPVILWMTVYCPGCIYWKTFCHVKISSYVLWHKHGAVVTCLLWQTQTDIWIT